MNRYSTERVDGHTIVWINGCYIAGEFLDAKEAFLFVEEQLEVERRVMRQKEVKKTLIEKIKRLLH